MLWGKQETSNAWDLVVNDTVSGCSRWDLSVWSFSLWRWEWCSDSAVSALPWLLGTRTSVLSEQRGTEMANLGDPASPPSVLRKSATSLKQDLKSVLWSQNKHPEIFIIMLLLKVLNVLYLKWNSFVLTCFHMLAFTRLQNCLIWLSNVTVMNLLGNGAIECIHCATPLWNILLDLLDSWFYFF